MIRILPIFKGYTVDMRLQEFRKISLNELPEFIPFTSDKGARLLFEFRKTNEGIKEITRYLNSN